MPLLASIGDAALKAYGFITSHLQDLYFNGVSLLFPESSSTGVSNGNYVDSSNNGLTVTPNGNVTQNTFSPFGYAGWSGQFNATTTYITYPASVLTVAAGSTFTIEGWICLAAYPAATKYACMLGYVDQAAAASWIFGVDSNGKALFYWYDGTARSAISTNAITINKWTYIQVSANAGVLSIAINGIPEVVTGTTTLTTPSAGVSNITTGAERGTIAIANYSGIRVSNIVRAPVLPTAYFTSDANTNLLTLQNNRWIDNSSNNHTITVNGASALVPISGLTPQSSYNTTLFAGSSAYDGTGDYLSIADNAVLEPGSSNFCVESLFYASVITGSSVIVGKRANSTVYAPFLIVRSTTSMLAYASSTGSSWDVINGVSMGTIKANQWNHVSIFRVGTAIYGSLNGTITTLNASTSATLWNNTAPIVIGSDTDGNGLTGYIAQTRYVVGSSVYTSSSAPIPVSALTNITNTQLLVNNTNANVINLAGRSPSMVFAGNTTMSGTQKKFGRNTLYFDGTGDYLQFSAGSMTQLIGAITANSTFTIEGFFYITAYPATTIGTIIGDMQPAGGTAYFSFGPQSNGTLTVYWTNPGANRAATTNAVGLNTWKHLAVSVNNGAISMYIDGVKEVLTGTTTLSTPNGTLGYLNMGTWSTFGTGMYVSNFRITRGVGRYTSSFTPPTQPYPTQ